MHFRLATAALLALSFSSLVSFAHAKDIRGFFGSGCTGSFSICLGLSSGQCCNAPGSPWTSVRVTDGSGVARTSGFSGSGCAGSIAIGLGGSCAGSGFALSSAQWIASGSRDGSAPRAQGASLPASECVEPQGFGFINQEGNVFEGLLPTAEKEKHAVIAAIKANDEQSIRKALGL